MFLEHYPGMTEKALAKIVVEAEQRWPLLKVEVLHRIGALEPGEPIVFVGVASAPPGGVRRLQLHHGLPEDPCAVLEERTDQRRPALGRGQAER
jgi:molybdopterin synthase catalytic subunit